MDRGFLAVHIAASFLAFVLAPVALVTANGAKTYRRWGKVYLWAMGDCGGVCVPDGAVQARVVSCAGSGV